MKQYLALLEDVLTNGVGREDRTGTGTIGVFGRQSRYDLRDGFPCLTTKKLHLRSIIYELLWFLKGETNIKFLKDNGVTIWDEWADENGELGPVYGAQWRCWPGNDGKPIDQIARLIDGLKTIRGPAGTSSARGTWPWWMTWRSLRVIPCSSSA